MALAHTYCKKTIVAAMELTLLLIDYVMKKID